MVALPVGSSTVKVSVFNTNRVLNVPASAFVTPNIEGTTYNDTPCLSFLIEHARRDGKSEPERYLFDLGIRKDMENLPPSVTNAVQAMGISITTRRDVLDELELHGVRPDSLNGLFLSHWHFDHIGDPSRFPKSMDIIAGPGFRKQCSPGFPANPDAMTADDALVGRDVVELDFSKTDLSIASLRAIDWFGDGSFFLLDTPGHAVGHISALARTTFEPPTFVLLAGDVCHHAGELRPNRQVPLLPTTALHPDPKLDNLYHPASYYCTLNDSRHRHPFYLPAPGGFNLDVDEMRRTVEKVALLDAEQNVFVLLAHDQWLLSLIKTFPADINGWKEEDLATRSRWRFLQDFT